MSRSDKWVPIDKNIVQEFKYIDRPFSRVEALVSFSIDFNCKCKWSLSGYAKQWQWSRCKVRKFVEDILSDKGHTLDRQQTHYRHPIHHIDLSLEPTLDTKETEERQSKDTKKAVQTPAERKTDARQTTDTQETDVRHPAPSNNKGLPPTQDTQETDARQTSDRRAYTTNKNNNKNNKKNSATEQTAAPKTPPAYITKKSKKLSGEKLVAFETFWENFGDKRGKAKAADVWLNIPGYTPELVKTISSAAKSFASHRPTIKAANLTPVMAEGWLSGRRWEDDLPAVAGAPVFDSAPNCKACDYFIRKSCDGKRTKCSSYRPHSTKA